MTLAEHLYAAMGRFAEDDDTGDLLVFCEALCAPAETAFARVSETDEKVAWQDMLDPEAGPAESLPWLAQFVGVEVEPAWTEQETRDAIARPSGWKRGTPGAMREAVQRTLTGDRTVSIFERVGGNAYQLAVRTLTTETPDADATEAAALTQKPIGIVLDFAALVGQAWNDVVADNTDWDEVTTTYATWDDLIATAP